MTKIARSLPAAALLVFMASGLVSVAAEDTPSAAPPEIQMGPGGSTPESEAGVASPDASRPDAPAPEAPGSEAQGPDAKAPDKPVPSLRDQYRAARRGYQGDPGLMGMNFPQSPEQATVVLDKLLANLSALEDPALSQKVMATIERIWRLPGGDTVNLLIDRAANAANQNNPDLALKLLDAAVDLAPDYPEAWSRRAFVHYMKGDTTRALGDLRRTLALEPNHFKALEGLAKILEETGQKKGALKALEELVKINPTTNGAKTAIENLKKEVQGQGI
ncbi:MAG: tetratricopeptide repeat protein [Hyphomicrobium sp.]